jgi:predicted HTH transcriptional regulator
MEITEMRDIILKFLLLFLLVGFIAFGSWYSERIKRKRKEAREAEEAMEEPGQDPRVLEKEARKRKIMEFFGSSLNRKATNNDIEELLGISDATVTRYLEELEKEGLIKQIGKTGSAVYYKKI